MITTHKYHAYSMIQVHIGLSITNHYTYIPHMSFYNFKEIESSHIMQRRFGQLSMSECPLEQIQMSSWARRASMQAAVLEASSKL